MELFKKEKDGDRRRITILGFIKINWKKKEKLHLRLLKKIKMSFDKKRLDPKYFTVCLSENEKQLFLKHIKKAQNYLEFGAGGSTFLTLLNSDAKINVVESDDKWLNSMREWEVIKHFEQTKRLTMRYINIGEVIEWGVPKNDECKELFPNYSNEIFNHIDKDNLDTVFVDGRFRVACALTTISNCLQKPKIIIHDFFDRPEYHLLLEFLNIVDSTDTLGVFEFKDNIDYKKVNELYEDYKYVSD